MNAMSRPLATLAAAAAGGVGLWLAGHWDTNGNGGYWAMLGVLALVGLLLGVSQLRAPDTNAPGMLLVAWLPVLIVAGWVLVSAQPDPNTFRDHVRAWNADMGIADVVHYVSPFVAVLALGIGLVFGFTLLTAWAMRATRVTVVDETPATAASEPVAATEPAPVSEPAPVTDGAYTRSRQRMLLVP
jgi:hypothetical protein